MKNLNVTIDGVKYIPENEKTIIVHGIEYMDIENWLLNIRAKLIGEWCDIAKKHDGEVLSDIPELEKKSNEIDEFKRLCVKYLGFEETSCGFRELPYTNVEN